MLVLGFQSPLVSAFYLLAVGLLAVHLSHGVTSVFRTLGLTSHNNATGLVKLGNLVGAAVFVGYGSIPVAVLAGFLKLQA
jgi:succinate dehydrogenase / fumarate reductase cytochrome b subunit